MNNPLPRRKIGPFSVTAIGLGCMNISHADGIPPSEEDATKLLYEAFDRGINFFDSAALYGLGHNETLLGNGFLKTHRNKIILASKGGVGPVHGKRLIDSRPESIRRDCEGSL
jgi:aryl-alcohol dehydrogenase-like predicted oxidoreductase